MRCGTRPLIITLRLYREEEHSLIFMSSLIRLIPLAIDCHSNAFASSAKSWITSSKFSFAIVHRVVMPHYRARIIIDECKLAKLLK